MTNIIKRITDELELRGVERYFKALSRLGPEILEIKGGSWYDIPYKITHRDSKYTPWHLRFTGIELPKYDKSGDGQHNGAVRMLFTHLLARQINWQKGCTPGDFNGLDGTNSNDTAHIPGFSDLESLVQSHDVARKVIGAYVSYKDKIDAAIKEIERIYGINPLTLKSKYWTDLHENSTNFSEKRTENYPFARELISELRNRYGLDYLTERLY